MSAQDFVFYFFAFLAVGSAVMVVILDNPVHSVMWLILNLIGVAVLYFTLQAPFLMAVQLIVYAGAIVVLFVFVVMLLMRQGHLTGTGPLAWLRPASFVGVLLLAVLLLTVAFVQPQNAANAWGGTVVGTPTAVGHVLYRDYLLPFEATSVLLLAALVGALYLGRHSRVSDSDEGLEPVERLIGGPPEDALPASAREDVHA